MDTMIIFSIALAAGLSVALVAWLITKLVSEVPAQDRTWNDSPPIGFRVLWWPIQWAAFYLQPFVSTKRKDSLLTKLRVAGLDYALNPLQFDASRIVWGSVFALIFYLIADSLTFSHYTIPLSGFILGYMYPSIWLGDVIKMRRNQMIKTLPFYLDIITLSVESGLNLNGALQQAVSKGPAGVLRDEFSRILRDIRAGSSRSDALRNMGQRLNHASITSFISTLIQAESTGISLGPILRAQAEQRRNERFTTAEKIAMEAPVKLLFPLLAFIFPCVFIILLFPIAMKFITQGI
jgi:tight adherence protein C